MGNNSSVICEAPFRDLEDIKLSPENYLMGQYPLQEGERTRRIIQLWNDKIYRVNFWAEEFITRSYFVILEETCGGWSHQVLPD